MDLIKEIWDSTYGLYDRYHLTDMSAEKRRKFLAEEVFEFVAASAQYENDETYDLQLLAEAADVLVTLVGVLQAQGVDLADFETAARIKLAGNDAKTEANGYRLVNGKITKVV